MNGLQSLHSRKRMDTVTFAVGGQRRSLATTSAREECAMPHSARRDARLVELPRCVGEDVARDIGIGAGQDRDRQREEEE